MERFHKRVIFLGYGANQEQRPGSVQGQVPPGPVEGVGVGMRRDLKSLPTQPLQNSMISWMLLSSENLHPSMGFSQILSMFSALWRGVHSPCWPAPHQSVDELMKTGNIPVFALWRSRHGNSLDLHIFLPIRDSFPDVASTLSPVSSLLTFPLSRF